MQLSSFENITEDDIVFHSAKKHKVPNSRIKYQRIKIERKLPNGKFSPLVVETPFLFSFGISERKDQETNKVSGYSIPVCLWKTDAEPNQKETKFLNIINKAQDLCRDHLSRDMVKMKPPVFLIFYITNKLSILMEKVKPRRKRIKQVFQFFT